VCDFPSGCATNKKTRADTGAEATLADWQFYCAGVFGILERPVLTLGCARRRERVANPANFP